MLRSESFLGKPVFQIAVPAKFRNQVLQASDIVVKYFFLPHLTKDASHSCQPTGKPDHNVKPAPLFPIPAVSLPSEYVGGGCVGPPPRSTAGSSYFLKQQDVVQRVLCSDVCSHLFLTSGGGFMSSLSMTTLRVRGRWNNRPSSLLQTNCIELNQDWDEGLPCR